MNDLQKDLLRIDFQFRREDIQQRIERIEGDIRYGIVGTGGLWAWIIANITDPMVCRYVVWLPLILALFMLIKFIAQDSAIKESAGYLKNIEAAIASVESVSFGWENYIKHEISARKLKVHLFMIQNYAFWLFLIVVNSLTAFYFFSVYS